MNYRERNLQNIQHARVRQLVDSQFNALHDLLEDAYYGDAIVVNGVFQGRKSNGWKHGVSHPVTLGNTTFNRQSTPQQSKDLFDKLHGFLFAKHHLALLAANSALPVDQQYSLDDLDPMDDPELVATPKRQSVREQDLITRLSTQDGISFDL